MSLIKTLIYPLSVPPPGLGLEPGGFVMPGGPGASGAPGALGVSGIPTRPRTVPLTGTFVPPPPWVPQPIRTYVGGVPPVVHHRDRAPALSESPVIPSPPSYGGDGGFIPPDLGPFQAGVALPQLYQPPVPVEEDLFIPPEPISRSPSIVSEEREPGSPSIVYPGPVGPDYGRGVGSTILPPPAVTYVHYPPRSPTSVSQPLTEREPEPQPHLFSPFVQYMPPEQVPVPTGRAPSGRTSPSRAPTIVEVTGPHILPPDNRSPRAEPPRTYRMYT
jgi:hypothetical protein